MGRGSRSQHSAISLRRRAKATPLRLPLNEDEQALVAQRRQIYDDGAVGQLLGDPAWPTTYDRGGVAVAVGSQRTSEGKVVLRLLLAVKDERSDSDSLQATDLVRAHVGDDELEGQAIQMTNVAQRLAHLRAAGWQINGYSLDSGYRAFFIRHPLNDEHEKLMLSHFEAHKGRRLRQRKLKSLLEELNEIPDVPYSRRSASSDYDTVDFVRQVTAGQVVRDSLALALAHWPQLDSGALTKIAEEAEKMVAQGYPNLDNALTLAHTRQQAALDA